MPKGILVLNSEEQLMLSPKVIEAVERVGGYPWVDVVGPRRSKPLIGIRHGASHYIHKHGAPWVTLKELGEIFRRHHTTVMHGIKTYDLYRQRPDYPESWHGHLAVRVCSALKAEFGSELEEAQEAA